MTEAKRTIYEIVVLVVIVVAIVAVTALIGHKLTEKQRLERIKAIESTLESS